MPCIIDGSIVGERFTTGIEQFLDSTLNPGDVVTMDNLGRSKAASFVQQARGYSSCRPTRPNLNPIEQVFAKLKTLLRKAEERPSKAYAAASASSSLPSPQPNAPISPQRRICFDLIAGML